MQAHDFVMVAGYPGHTQRWQTAGQIEFAITEGNPRRIGILSAVGKLYDELAAQSEDISIKVQPSIRGVMNYLQLLELIQDNVKQNDVLAEKIKQENQLRQWISADPERMRKWGSVLDEIAILDDEQNVRAAGNYLLHCTTNYVRMLESAHTIVRMAEERPKPDAEREPEFQQRNWDRIIQRQQRTQKSYDPIIDKAVLKFYLKQLAQLSADQNKPVLKAFNLSQPVSDPQLDEFLDGLFTETLTIDAPEVRVDLLENASLADLKESTDPFIQLALKIRPLTKEMEDRHKIYEGKKMLLNPVYVQARKAFYNRPLAPDANGTLRVTYGTVRGYRPAPDADMYEPFTTLSSLIAKHTGDKPFNAPDELLAAARNVSPKSPCYSNDIGDIPVNFLSDLDITGGNSGSATLNRKGELVGLIFDGNSEALASNLLFMPDITRSIHVDIRYVLWVMKHVDGADNLLKELNFQHD